MPNTNEPEITHPVNLESDDPDWLVRKDLVISGGPGRDVIPSIDNPKFLPAEQINFLEDDDLVLAININGHIKAYPHPILDWHEIVNDELEGEKFSLNYCPLTGTGIGWDRIINNEETTFGVSGLLYNSNMIPFDRNTESLWSQLRLECINGDLISERAKNHIFLETSWKTFKQAYPQAEVLTTETGFSRSYGVFPYRDYRENHDYLLFPIAVDDDRLERKERVLVLLFDGQTAVAYSFDSFFGNGIESVFDNVNDQDLIIVGSKEDNFLVAFSTRLKQGGQLSFTILDNQLPKLLKDNEGNIWDIFGYAVEGPRLGQRLDQPVQMMGYWFSFGSFYSDLDIY